MRKSLLLVQLLISFALLTCGCQKVDSRSNYLYAVTTELPLKVGNSWTYQVTRQDGFNPQDGMTATSTLTDTVTSSGARQGFWVAQIQSVYSAEILQETHGNYPAAGLLEPAHTAEYWFILDGQRLLQQQADLDLANLQSQGLVEVVFPLRLGTRWSLYNSSDAAPDAEVKQAGSISVPAGTFSDCFYLEGTVGGTTFSEWLCPGTGIVWRSVLHNGTPFGYKQELASYKVR